MVKPGAFGTSNFGGFPLGPHATPSAVVWSITKVLSCIYFQRRPHFQTRTCLNGVPDDSHDSFHTVTACSLRSLSEEHVLRRGDLDVDVGTLGDLHRSPMNSMMETSSVTSYPFKTSLKPSLSRSGLITRGVCISHSLLRSAPRGGQVVVRLLHCRLAPDRQHRRAHRIRAAPPHVREVHEGRASRGWRPARRPREPRRAVEHGVWRSLPGSANLTGFDTGTPRDVAVRGSH